MDYARVPARTRDRGRIGLQCDERRCSTRCVEHADSAQLLGDRHIVCRLTLGVKRSDGIIDVGVRRFVEVLGTDLFDHDRDRIARKQHGPEHGFLGIKVVRWHPRAARSHHRRRRPRAAPAPRHVGHGLQDSHHAKDERWSLGAARAGSCGLPAEFLEDPVHGTWTSVPAPLWVTVRATTNRSWLKRWARCTTTATS